MTTDMSNSGARRGVTLQDICTLRSVNQRSRSLGKKM